MREDGGVVALGRVLTLIIRTQFGREEESINAANEASREHPMRVIVVAADQKNGQTNTGKGSRLDAQIRVGGDAGASDVIVLKVSGAVAEDEESLVTGLLLPDAPVVVWWPGEFPENVSQSNLGKIAQRRITDSSQHHDPLQALEQLSHTYSPGDTDFAWTRVTLWRAQLAAILDQPPFDSVDEARVSGASDSPSTVLIAAWLKHQLGVPVECTLTQRSHEAGGIHRVQLVRASGTITLERTNFHLARLLQPHQPTHTLALPRRNLRDCLAEELRRLDPDDLYGEIISQGFAALCHSPEFNNTSHSLPPTKD